MIYHSTMGHLVKLRKSCDECLSNKTNLLCCFVEFRETFDAMPMTNLRNRLEKIKFPFGLRNVAIGLHDKFISKLTNFEGW